MSVEKRIFVQNHPRPWLSFCELCAFDRVAKFLQGIPMWLSINNNPMAQTVAMDPDGDTQKLVEVTV
jgi:hypothetical protein